MPDARCTRSLVCKEWWHTSVATTSTPGSPGIPARNGFNSLLRALPGDRAFLSPSSAETWLVRARSGRLAFRKLDAGVEASGPHVFALREPHRSSACRPSLTGDKTRPAIPCIPDAAASTATRPNVHDDGQRPSDRDGMATDIK